jgi:hypothetical protein
MTRSGYNPSIYMRILPVAKVGPKLYFIDERLRQYRSVVPCPEIIEFIEFGQEPPSRGIRT